MKTFAGLTIEDCATACGPDGCVIAAGLPQCMHPCKGAVPPHLKSNADVMKLRAEACAVLGVKNTHVLEGATS
jgi:hypothetical protein